jgi:hypothetical protein
VEHLVQQDSPGAPPRAETHPLAPPPLPFTSQATAPAPAVEPPPLPELAPAPPPPHAPEAHLEEPEAKEELLDLNDFSFDIPQASTAASPPATYAASDTEAVEESSDAHAEEHANWSAEDLSAPTAAGETTAHEDVPPPLPPDVPVGFEPFSGLESDAKKAESDNVDGLETYTFEAPEGAVADASEDVGSFYMESSYPTPEPAERVEQTESPSIDVESAPQEGAQPAEGESHEPARGDDVGEVAATGEIDAPDDLAVQATKPVASTPIATAPVITTPVASSTPSVAAAAAADSSSARAETDAFATETMAKLYMSQGHLESALGIYRTLAAKRPDDESLRGQIEELEERVQRRRREPTPPAPSLIEAGSGGSHTPEVAAPAERATPLVARPVGPTIRDFLLAIIRRGAGAGTSSANGGTIDALFDGEDALGDDLTAADTLAQAFAPPTEQDPISGNPAREASTELSLDRVFRQPTPAHAGEAATGFSFDEFFADERGEDPGAAPAEAPGDPEDIEQFNAWLNGLKKS